MHFSIYLFGCVCSFFGYFSNWTWARDSKKVHFRICEDKHFINVLILLQKQSQSKKYPWTKGQLFLVVDHRGLSSLRTLWEKIWSDSIRPESKPLNPNLYIWVWNRWMVGCQRIKTWEEDYFRDPKKEHWVT